jgi:hypothetical protein
VPAYPLGLNLVTVCIALSVLLVIDCDGNLISGNTVICVYVLTWESS